MQNNEIRITGHKIILTIILFSIVIMGANVDIFVPSLPAIHLAFDTSMRKAQAVVTTYLFAYGIFQLVAGGIADSFGRRKTILSSSAAFVITTFIIPFSPNIYVLLGLRLLQGIFAAGMAVCLRTILSDVFSGSMLAKAATYLTFFWAIGPIISPFLGGYLQHLFGWKASFYFLGGYSLIALIAMIFFLPETITTKHKFHITTISKNYFKIYTNNIFIIGALTCGCAYSFITIFNVTGPFLIQNKLNYSPVFYGHIALFLGLSWLAGNLLCRLINTKSYCKKVITYSNAIAVAISLIMTITVRLGVFNIWNITIPTLCLFFITGIIFPYFFGHCLSLFPQIGGTASAAMGTLYTVMAAAVSSLSTLLKSATLTPLAYSYLALAALTLFFILLRNNMTKNVQP